VKICGNPATCARMTDNIDVDAGGIITGDKTIEDVGRDILARIAETADGKLTRAEQLGHREYFIPYKPGRACDVV